MNDKNFLSLLQKYKERIEKLKSKTAENSYNEKVDLEHLLSMLPIMEKFIQEGQREKFFRWLGFMQGVFWSLGEFSLDELRNHNSKLK